jgi:hypothetical protein
MKRRLAWAVLFVLLLLPVSNSFAARHPIAEERAEHPRIAKAIHSLEDAIAYMEHAPHDFGGHKAEAIAASRNAIVQLKLALAYRAAKENH